MKQHSPPPFDTKASAKPPALAETLLSFFLPNDFKEPILGDLEEEFAEKMRNSEGTVGAIKWYWRQAFRSACLFLWQQRGTVMAYLISVVFFLGMLGLAAITADFGIWLISPPVLIATIPASILLGIGATSARSAKLALRLSFGDTVECQPQDAAMARRFLNVAGNQFLLVSGVVFLLGFCLLLIGFSQQPVLLTENSRFLRYGTAVLPLFYGLIFKCLCYSAEQKLVWKYT